MSYVVLARRLRPTQFDDLVGQETIAQILKNAILTDRVSHAFLFTGSRGVGKTSAARMLTKAINCLDLQGADPCEKCQNCIDIINNASPDIFEIDAASNRGIDNIRELRENIKYAPANCRYKVYIIDEAHMLTLESFNALLKTLEEPPAHVKFILATTDPHKIPQTIISRCQRYDFVRIPLNKIVDYLEKVVQNEGIKLSRKALEMVAHHAIGGMRDALTTIDQIVSYTGTASTDEEVAQILGMVDSQVRFRLLTALIEKNPTEAMTQFYEMQEHGHDYQDILSELLQSVKNLSLVHTLIQNSGTVPPTLFQDMAQEDVAHYQQIVARVNMDELQQMFHILLELEERIKRSNHAQICFEMALIQLTSIQSLVGITDLLKQIQDLGGGNGGGKLISGTQKKTSVLAQQPPQTTKGHPSFSGHQNVIREEKTPADPAPAPEVEPITPPSSLSQEMVTVGNSLPPLPSREAVPVMPPSLSQETELVSQVSSSPSMGKFVSPSLLPSQEWEAFVEHVQQKSPRIGSVLKNAVLLERNEHQIQIAFKETQFAKMLSGEQLTLLKEITKTFYREPMQIVVQEGAEANEIMTLSEKQQRVLKEERERRRHVAEQDEQTQIILKTFPGSKIVDIQIQEPKL